MTPARDPKQYLGRAWGLGTWALGFGPWALGPGPWDLGLGPRHLRGKTLSLYCKNQGNLQTFYENVEKPLVF